MTLSRAGGALQAQASGLAPSPGLGPLALPPQRGPRGLRGPILELASRSGSHNLSLEPHQSLIKACPINVKKFTHKKIPCM